MLGATLERALRSSVFHLAAERRRLESELLEMEKRMTAVRTGAEARTLSEQMEAARAQLAALQARQDAEDEAKRQAARAAAAKAKREALTGHSRMLADAHDQKLEALTRAEAHMAAAVGAINQALQAEAMERKAAGALAVEMNVQTTGLNLSGDETVRRLVGGICSHLTRISACRMRRLAYLTLPDHPHTRGTDESWREREARATSASVEMLLAHAETLEKH
jgi:hypothetical protein